MRYHIFYLLFSHKPSVWRIYDCWLRVGGGEPLHLGINPFPIEIVSHTILQTISTMISIKYSDIPCFLHNSSFYQSLCDRKVDDNIEIPEQCFVFIDDVSDFTDFTNLMKVSAFWGLKSLPISIINFCHDNPFDLWSGVLLDEFAEMDFAQDLVACFDPDAWPPGIVHAIQVGRTELVEFLACKPNASADGIATAAFHGRVDYI